MTVTAPPRPPRPSDPVTHGEFDALVDALIVEARQRQRRRRLRNGAIVAVVAIVGSTLFAILGRSAQSQTASSVLSARSSLTAAATSSKIAFISEGSPGSGGYCGVVYAMNADGSDQRRLSNGGVPGCGQEGSPAWSSDGRIAFVSDALASPTWVSPLAKIYVMNADGSDARRLTRTGGMEGSPAWSPDGRKVAFTNRRQGTRGIYVANADGSAQRRLTRTGGSPTWSPDGRRIALVGSVGRGGHNSEIYVVNADGTAQRRLTRNTVRDSQPVWSPDGRRIAFESNWQLWVMNADGSGKRRLTDSAARNYVPGWSPDGQRIAFERRVGRQKHRNTPLEYGQCSRCGPVSFQVWVMNANGSEARKLAQDGAQPFWSPDGRKIAFEYPLGRQAPGGLGKQSDIYVMNADGSRKRNLTRTPRSESQPVWSPVQK